MHEQPIRDMQFIECAGDRREITQGINPVTKLSIFCWVYCLGANMIVDISAIRMTSIIG